MEVRVERLRIGPFRLVRRLEAGSIGERWLAFNEQDQSSHVAHRVKLGGPSESRRFVRALEAISQLKHPHLLAVEHFSLGDGGDTGWIVTPFTGSHDGLVTLPGLLGDKGGKMSPLEVERCLMQLLEALEYTHGVGCFHGNLDAADVLVDRRGSLFVELYGLRRQMAGSSGGPPAGEVARDEVRSIVSLGYWLLTGLPGEEPRIEASRLIRGLDDRWDEFFAQGLEPLSGFESAGEAMAALPSVKRELEPRSPVQVVIRGFRRALKAQNQA
jgi:serine/threonine protein kinase